MPDPFDAARAQVAAIEEFFDSYAFSLGILQRGAEKVAITHLRKSEYEADRLASVTTETYGTLHFRVVIQKPKVHVWAKEARKLHNGDLYPFWEMHGPKGRIKITRSAKRAHEAKKQGIHTEIKYHLPDGTVTGDRKGIYQAAKIVRQQTCFARVLEENAVACTDILNEFDSYLTDQLDTAMELKKMEKVLGRP